MSTIATYTTVTIILVNRKLPVQTFLRNLHEILMHGYGHLHQHHKFFKIISLHLPNVTFQLFLYYARECSIIPELDILIKIATYYSQNYTGRYCCIRLRPTIYTQETLVYIKYIITSI